MANKMEMNPVVWFEVPVCDLGRAKAFYEDVLAVQLQEQTMGELEMAMFPMQGQEVCANGATGALVKGDSYGPTRDGVLVYFTTADIDAALSRAEAGGGSTLTPKTSIGEYGFIGVMQDCEGNRIGLHAMS